MKLTPVLIAALFVLTFTTSAMSADRTLNYDIVRNDKSIGTHRVVISDHGVERRVHVETHIEIESFFITEYAFDFSSEEIWRDGRLITLSSTTTEDGEKRGLHVFLEGERYAINAISTNLDRLQRVSSSTIFPATSWTPQVAQQTRLFDTTSGVILNVEVQQTDSNTYDISGEWTRTLTYDDAGTLVEMRFPDRTKTDVFFRLK